MSKNIKTEYTEDSVTGLRVGNVRISGKKVETPVKVFELSKLKSNISLNNKIRGVNEIYKIFPSETIKTKTGEVWKRSINDYRGDGQKNTQLTNELNRLAEKANIDEEITFCFTGFDGLRYPDEGELRFLATRSFCYSSDIVPLPILPKITKIVDINTYSEYLNFLQRTLEEYKMRNNKPLMGVIPIKLGSIIWEEALDFYIENDLTAFCVDFGGCTVTSQYPDIIDLYKRLDEYKLADESLLYSINVGAGRASRKKPTISAKDILSFGYGFDMLGRSQSPPIPERNMIDTSEMRLRIFNKKDYGYYRVIGSDIRKVYPTDSSIPVDTLTKIKVKTTKKGNTYLDTTFSGLFNLEQQGFEAQNLRQVVVELTEKYIGDKSNIDKKDKKQILHMRDDIKSKQLDLDKF